MAIATALRQYLDRAGIKYELVHHTYANSSLRTAEAAHIPGEQLAKPVMLEDETGFLMAVVPANCRVDLETLERKLHRHLGLAKEQKLIEMFGDCTKGAIPAVGQAYGVQVVWDDSFSDCADVYFEAGDHLDLVHISGRDFRALMGKADHGRFSKPS